MPKSKNKGTENHYVNNKELYAEMCAFKESVRSAEESGEPRPRIPNKIGEALLAIGQRLSTKPNFANYTYREEMVSDGIENCVVYIDNFDPEKSTNPFAYFTQIIYYAFLRRIQKEEKQQYIVHKVTERSLVHNELVHSEHDGDALIPSYIDVDSDYVNDFVSSFESKEQDRRDKRRQKKKGLQPFYEGDTKEK